jgi:ribosomal protein S12 methylthiotransferase accessory factor YcaO
MTKKINVTGKPARRIDVSGKPQRRIDPEQFAAALGAEAVGEPHAPNLDPLSLAALGSELIKRLRSTGGRPALADATEICRVPLSAEDVKTLEAMVGHLEASSGAKPSVGKLVSVIVREHLQALKPALNTAPEARTEPDQPTLKAALGQLVEEHIRPLREQVRRLEAELHAVNDD